MKRLIYLIVFSLCFMAADRAMAQKRNTGRASSTKTSVKSKTKSSKTAVPAKSKAKEPEKKMKQRTYGPVFQGKLVYDVTEYYSGPMESLEDVTQGEVYNGKRTKTYSVSGNKLHLYDKDIAMHTILDFDKNICIVYSELTKKGVEISRGLYEMQKCILGSASARGALTWDKPNDAIVNGDTLLMKHAVIKDSVFLDGQVESYETEIYSSPNIMSAIFNGLFSTGLVKRWICETRPHVQNQGPYHKIEFFDLKEIVAGELPPSEFEVPKGIKIVQDDFRYEKTREMAEKHRQKMNKMKMTPIVSISGIYQSLKSEWPMLSDMEVGEDANANKLIEKPESKAKTIAKAVAGGLAELPGKVMEIIKPQGSVSQGGEDGDLSDGEITSTARSGKSGMSQGEYQSDYDFLARHAESVYDSLTNLGGKTTDSSGNEEGHAGGVGGYKGSTYVSLKKNLRDYQRKMSKLRDRARADGYELTKSKYETITVSYE